MIIFKASASSLVVIFRSSLSFVVLIVVASAVVLAKPTERGRKLQLFTYRRNIHRIVPKLSWRYALLLSLSFGAKLSRAWARRIKLKPPKDCLTCER